jgi:hypothetical protein
VKAWPEVVAFAALVGGATWLEVSGKDAFLQWWVLLLWAIFTDWGQKTK